MEEEAAERRALPATEQSGLELEAAAGEQAAAWDPT